MNALVTNAFSDEPVPKVTYYANKCWHNVEGPINLVLGRLGGVVLLPLLLAFLVTVMTRVRYEVVLVIDN